MNDEFYRELNNVWLSMLMNEWTKIYYDVSDRSGGKYNLVKPNFDITSEAATWLGKWYKDGRIIKISNSLLRGYSWEAVKHVLKHETAHMIVDEFLGGDVGHPHGDFFKAACKVVDVSSERCLSNDYINSLGNNGENPVMVKIRKLLAKGNDGAVTDEEAQTFLTKAREIMLTNNIDEGMLGVKKDVWVFRPVTVPMKREPIWHWKLARLMNDLYNVRHIRLRACSGIYYQMFGEVSDVDIAEYVFHVLMHQAQRAFKEYQKSRKGEYGRASMIQFVEGLVCAYRERFCRKDVSSVQDSLSGNEIMLKRKKKVEDKFNEMHPDLKTIKRYYTHRGTGWEAGNRFGKTITVNDAVHSGKKQLALT